MRKISGLFQVVLIGVVAGLAFNSGATAQSSEDIPEVVRSFIDEGNRHAQAGRLDAAVESYSQAQRLAPEVPAPYLSLGAIYARRGEFEDAYTSFTGGLEHAPEDPQLLFNAAVVGRRLGLYDKAFEFVDKALSRDRRNGVLLALHGTVLRDLGRNEEAVESLEAAVKADGSAQNFFRLGNLYSDLERREDAVDAYEKAIKKDKKYVRAYFNLGAVLFALGRDREALEAYDVALEPVLKALTAGEKVGAENARAFLNLGAIHVRGEDWKAALDAYRKALQLNPNLSEARYNEGFIHFRQGDWPAAEQAYRAALELDEDLPLAHFHLGLIAGQRGRYEDSVRWLENALERFGTEPLDQPTHRDTLLALGVGRRELGRTADAAESLRAVLGMDPDNVVALTALGRLLRRQGNDDHLASDEARQLLERARELQPEDAAVGLELAMLARADNDTARERAYYEEILDRSDDASLWPVRVNLAVLLLRQGDRAAARGHFEPVIGRLAELRAGGLTADQGHLLATAYALLLAADGDRDSARQTLNGVLAENSNMTAAAEAAAVLDTLAGDPAAGAQALEKIAQAGSPNLDKALWLAGRETSGTAGANDVAVRIAQGEAALTKGDYDGAVRLLDDASALCGAQPSAPSPPAPSPAGASLQVRLGASSPDGLCQRLQRGLAQALLGQAVTAAGRARQGGAATARAAADRALALPLEADERPTAFFARGIGRLTLGDNRGARSDLQQALQGNLPEAWIAVARNNLGLALLRLDDVAGARRELEAARAAAPEATLNLAILLDDYANESRAALDLYEEYLRQGGDRQRDANTWAERLRRVYQ